MTLGSLLDAGRLAIQEAVIGSSQEPDTSSHNDLPLSAKGTSASKTEPSASAVHQQDLLSPTESKGSMAVSDDTGYHTATEGHPSPKYSDEPTEMSLRSQRFGTEHKTEGLDGKSSSATKVKMIPSPPIPPRPIVCRPGGLLSLRRAESSRSHAVDEAGGRSIEQRIQTMSAPNMRVVMPPAVQNDDPKREPPEAVPSEWVEPDLEASELGERPMEGRHGGTRRHVRSPLSVDSEASTDTVVDWSHNTSHIPVPTMTLSPAPSEQPTPTLKRSFARKPKKPSPSSLDLNHSVKSDDTIVQWSSLKKSPRIFDIHKDLMDPYRAGSSGAIEQTPPPDVPLLLDSDTQVPMRKIHSALKETPADPAHAQTISFPVVKPHKAFEPKSSNPTPSPRKDHETPVSSGPRPLLGHPSRPLPQTYTPPGVPPFSSPLMPPTFTPSGPPPTAPPLPPRSLPRTATIASPSNLPLGELGDQMQRALHRDLRAFRRDIHHEFEKQKVWFENIIRERDHWMMRVEEENGRLREELARARPGKRR